MTSRLDRLFVLLEAGAGAATRRAAARQLGEIQKARPEELHRLLGRLMKHLKSPAWETRVAAAQAVEAILANVPEWHPSPLTGIKEEKPEEDVTRLRCETFDIESVLKNGAHLMGSEGREYDQEDENLGAADMKERIAKQRQKLNKQLGLDVAAAIGVDLTSVYTNDDLCPSSSSSSKATVKIEMSRRPVQELVPSSCKPLSSREMNLAKRKARQALCKQKSRDCSEEAPPTPEPDRKKPKLEPDECDFEAPLPVPDCSGAWGETPRWPLEAWCGTLQALLFGAAWETRHGAASALRELLKARVSTTAGHAASMTKDQMQESHQNWLEDMALRLLCVLALDRFGDFVSDQVVAPVRETCAQTLGVALAQLETDRVRKVAQLLATLAQQSQWECRHGALLGFKYLLAARQELAVETRALDHIISGLSDSAEDVSCVAALALAPHASLASVHGEWLAEVVARLWTLLRDQDELAAPASAYLALLAALMALPQAATILHPIDLSDVLPRLWPYLDHSTSSVRKATLQTMRTLTRPLITFQTNGESNRRQNSTETVNSQNGAIECQKNSLKTVNSHQNSTETVNSHQNSTETVNSHQNPTETVNSHQNSTETVNSHQNSTETVNSHQNSTETVNSHQNSTETVNSHQNPTETVNSHQNSCQNDDKTHNKSENGFNVATEALEYSNSQLNSDKVSVTSENVVKTSENAVKTSENVVKTSENLLEGEIYLKWTPELLQEAMRHVYQRILFEHVHEIQEIALQVWQNFLLYAHLATILIASCPVLATWLCLAMQPARLHVEPNLLVAVPPKERRPRTLSQSDSDPPEVRPNQKWFIGGSESQPLATRDRNVMRARCLAAKALGHLSCYLVQPAPGIEYGPDAESPIDCYVKVMVVYLRSGSALQRLVAGLVISAWARHTDETKLYPPSVAQNGERVISDLAPPLLTATLHTALNQTLYYDEVALNCNRLLQEARDLYAMMKHYKLPIGDEFNIVRLEQVLEMTMISEPMISAMKLKRVATTLSSRRQALQSSVEQCTIEQTTLNVSVQAALAGACANLHSLPDKLNPVIKPLMESIKREPSEELQANSADSLAELLAQLARRESCPNNKVLVNLKAFLRCDPEYTPRICLENTEENGDSASDSGAESNDATTSHGQLDKYNGILTLLGQRREADKIAPRRGRPPASGAAQIPPPQILLDDEPRKLLRIQRRGAILALTRLTSHCGHQLPSILPKLWEFIVQPLNEYSSLDQGNMEVDPAEELISCLQVIEVVCLHIAPALWQQVISGTSACAALTRAVYTGVRHMAARCLAAMANRDPLAVMKVVIDELLPALSDVRSERARCGAAEALARVVEALQLRVVPYIVLLVVPLLGRMSDHCEAVRMMSTRCFAALIQLMPLDGAIPEPEGLAPDLKARRAKDKQFLDQLFHPKSIKDYKIPVPISVELRSYQQAGVNWLRFLYEYKLHGVLCDDMGLGKTLQSVAIVASSHWERQLEHAPHLPSLVVCPPTLTGHWVFEVNKFIPTRYLKPLQYVGPPVERERLRTAVKHYDLIVASYDIVRKDIDFFSKIKWNYCVLDEGHVIKNGKTKAFKAIKQVVANHRLILSGTPIQNNVLELWSLFDFLMPGLLGSEREFTARYSRPILAARDPKATPHQLQGGALACEALHRQVLPFLLRRVKEDVLKELPPKITQDYYCDLSPLQRRLYEHFSKQHMPNGIADSSHTHVFQALHYLQNVCNHPKLVLTADHPEAAAVTQQLAHQGSSLDDIDHSAKLPALKQLLLDCGIGTPDTDSEVIVSQHRALIFCQLKKMLDIVERDLLQRHLPRVTYLRLDGSVPAHQRHAIVTRFNNDVSIDVLLLTTQVGGLGLNLTGADTVIFVEHDWNPMKDLQAMDRAHRIGQKRVVNVYRLITRDTLEEKIMGLQKFKLQTANTVISSENAAMETMGTEQLLDLFQLSSGKPQQQPVQLDPIPGPSHALAITETLPDLWDDRQYEEEYDMTSFIQSLHKMTS